MLASKLDDYLDYGIVALYGAQGDTCIKSNAVITTRSSGYSVYLSIKCHLMTVLSKIPHL